MQNLTFQDEKGASRYNTLDQPPSYEALYAEASTPSSLNIIATRSTTTRLPNTSFLPCVVPRKQSLATTLRHHQLRLSRNIQTLRQRLRQPLHPRLPTLPPNPQHHPIRLPRLHRRPQPSLHLKSDLARRQRRRLDHADAPRHAHSANRRHGRANRLGPGFSRHLIRTHESLPSSLQCGFVPSDGAARCDSVDEGYDGEDRASGGEVATASA